MAKTSRRNSKRTSNKLTYKWAAGLVLLALLLAGGYYAFIRDAKPSPTDTDTQALQQKKALADANAQAKKSAVESSKSATDQTSNSTGSTNTSNITSLTARQETNGTVTVFTKLNPSITGSCSLTTTNGSKSNAQKADVIYQSEFSSCAGFSVPISGLGAGTWNIQLTVGSSVKSIQLGVK